MAKRLAKKAASKAPTASETTVVDVVTFEATDSFESPESSNITGAQYSSKTWTLRVTFHQRKAGKGRANTYEYCKHNSGKMGVPEYLWGYFKDAVSKGRFFTSEILPFYKGTAIQEPVEAEVPVLE